ncbi:MAG: CHAD domain-containing protein, partial [Planctomycetes bacterium]|nr:CHAD domain-containing protein [Planctomycetota bacterium]
ARHHSNTYLDDELGSLQQNGYALRVRASQKGRRLTCKARGRLDGAMHVRREIEAAWPSDQLPTTAAELPAELRDVVQPFVLERALQPRQRLEVHREIRILTDDGDDLCELAIDSVEALANGRTAAFQEIELEVFGDVPTNERIAHELRERLPVEFATDDKPTHAAALLGIERPAPATPARAQKKKKKQKQKKKSTNDPTGSEPVGQAVPQRLLAEFAAMRRCEHPDRDQPSTRDRHRMRVAVRRMRTLARTFGPLWPEDVAGRLSAHLGQTGRQLGVVRDLDVLLSGLPQSADSLPPQLQPAGQRAIDWVREQREAAEQQLQDWLCSPERLAANEQFERDVAAIDERTALAAEPLCRAAPPLLAAAVTDLRERLAAIPDDLPTEPLHRLRLATKRARYLAAELAGVPGMQLRKPLRALARAQRRLGTVCDHEVAAERLLGYVHAASTGSSDGAWTAAAFGGLAAVHAMAASATRPAAARALARLDRKRIWQRLAPL